MLQRIERIPEMGVDSRRTLYADFESNLLFSADASNLRSMVGIFYKIYPESKGKEIYLLPKEIRNISDWGYLRGAL